MSTHLQHRVEISTDGRSERIPLPLIFLFAFAAVALTHLTLLKLPYFWDEGGYYVPAALDFYHTGTLIPVFTNAHPPLPNVLLGSFWHLFGFHIVVTRLVACAAAAFGLTAVFALGRQLLGGLAGGAMATLTAVYPIWFAQSSLAHADIFAAAFTLSALVLYLPAPELGATGCTASSTTKRRAICSSLFCLSVLAKETAVVEPLTLLAFALLLASRSPRHSEKRRAHLLWARALVIPLVVLGLWYGYHYARTGYVFGNSVYLRYNATANFTFKHVLYAFRIRFVHLFWQRQLWVPLLLAGACMLLPPRTGGGWHAHFGLPSQLVLAIATLVLANWLAFSILGGALLTRYLLPVYPLLLLLSVAIWKQHLKTWCLPVLLTAIAFTPAIWINPSNFFAPEDNLTYRDMVVVHQRAIQYLKQHYPKATVLTAWPVSADLSRPELGYVDQAFHVVSMEGFGRPELAEAAEKPGQYDTALVFTTHYTSPAFRSFLLQNPTSWRGRRYAADLDLSPGQIAAILGGEVVWQENVHGEWAGIIRFTRNYDAHVSSACDLSLPGSPPGSVGFNCF